MLPLLPLFALAFDCCRHLLWDLIVAIVAVVVGLNRCCCDLIVSSVAVVVGLDRCQCWFLWLFSGAEKV